MKHLREYGEEADVDLAPLIDCVFLLLIFFLVSTQLSEFEQHLELELPESAAELAGDTRFDNLRYRYHTGNEALQQTAGGKTGQLRVDSDAFRQHLKQVAAERGTDTEILVEFHPDTPFQQVIAALDTFKLMGFNQLEIRIYGIKGNFRSG